MKSFPVRAPDARHLRPVDSDVPADAAAVGECAPHGDIVRDGKVSLRGEQTTNYNRTCAIAAARLSAASRSATS